MERKVVFLTGNQDKIKSAQEVFKEYPGFLLLTQKIDVPEIQSLDVQEVAEYAVKWACEQLNEPVFKVDCGYYFEGLKGFPGALVKYFESTFSSEDILSLLGNKSRVVHVRECLSYCEPEREPASFVSQLEATIAQKPAGEGGSIDRLIVYKGFSRPQAACDYNQIVAYWNEHLTHYQKFADYLKKRTS